MKAFQVKRRVIITSPITPHPPDIETFDPSPEDVAYRAYLNYQNHGQRDGHDLDDWVTAKAELIAEHTLARSDAGAPKGNSTQRRHLWKP